MMLDRPDPLPFYERVWLRQTRCSGDGGPNLYVFALCTTSWQQNPLESDGTLETDFHSSLLDTVVRVTGKPPLDCTDRGGGGGTHGHETCTTQLSAPHTIYIIMVLHIHVYMYMHIYIYRM